MRRSNIWRWIAGVALALAAAFGLLVVLWDWNWLRPLVEARGSAGIGRKMTMGRLEVHPGRRFVIVAHGLHIANPDGFDGPDFAVIPRLSITFDAEAWLRTRRIVLPLVQADQPVFNVLQTAAGQNNWTLALPAPDSTAGAAAPPPVEIGDVVIEGGTAHAVSPLTKSDITMAIATSRTGDARTLIVEAKGTYANQPVAAHLVGGALLSLRDASSPYPVDFSLANGDTRITLKGTVINPIALTGADLDLVLVGPDMALLFPLTGIPIPKTPPYKMAGKLDFADGRIKFTNIKGQVGSTDLNGAVELDPHGARPVLTGVLSSRTVDMEDLAGFIGSQPGRTTTPGQSPRQVQDVKRAEADPRLLPTMPIDLPKLRAADIHITYKGDKVLGKNVPFEALSATADIVDGHIRLTALRVGLGGGALTGTIDLNPVGDELDTDASVTMKHVNIAKLLASAGLGNGQGSIDGTAKLKGRGASMSAIVGRGDGAVHVVMARGGDVNALLVALSGGEIGRAVLAAIGVPDKERIRCMVADFVLQRGILASRTLVVDTTDHIITGGGRIDLSREILDLYLRTDAKHFTIGTLATPLRVFGPFKNLSFVPDPELLLRGGAAIGLGVLFPPAALLPTIQFGVGEASPCADPKK